MVWNLVWYHIPNKVYMYIYNAVLSGDLVGFFLNGFITYKPMLVVE